MPLDDFSWAVGLFEGEGSISIGKTGSNYYRPRIIFTMTDKDIIDRFVSVFPGGSLYEETPESRSGRVKRNKTIYRYHIQSRSKVENFLIQVQPYLSIKKQAECEKALTLINESKLRTPNAPVRLRPQKSLTDEEITAMRQDRHSGMRIPDICTKYMISRSHVIRLTKESGPFKRPSPLHKGRNGELRELVEQYLNRNPGSHTVTTISSALNRNAGALYYALRRLIEMGKAVQTSSNPMKFSATSLS